MQEIANRMTVPAREHYYKNIAPKLAERASKPLRDALFRDDYLWPPVSVEQFVQDKRYLGNILHGNIYPKILEDLIELFEGQYTEVLLTGSIGWGKSVFAEIGIAYDLYKVSCLKNPADAYGLLPNSNVAFLNISVNKTQATKVIFGGIGNLIRNSPYFKEQFPYNASITTELRFPRGVFAYPVAATGQAILGEGVFSAAFDEMNFYAIVEKSKQNPEGGAYDQAVALYTKMSRRIKSRMNSRGALPGHVWLVSSARYPNDFTERKEQEALSDPTIFVRRYALWDTQPRSKFMTETFKVEVGDVSRRSRVLDGSETNVDQSKVITVPWDFKADFDKEPDEAVRDFAGIPVLSIHPFIGRRDAITEMMRQGMITGLKHPFSDITVTLQQEKDHLLPDFLDWVYEKDKPRRLAHGPYFAHADLAKGKPDAAGFAVAHIVGNRQVTRGFGRERKFETRPVIRLDLALEIIAPPRGEVQFASVRELLYQLRDLGMQFQMVTYDSYGSADSIQILKSEGFNAEELSVDTDIAPYEALKQAIYDGRLLCYDHPRLAQQLATLLRDEKKGTIDHPPHGAKDIADAVAGAVWNAEKSFAEGVTGAWQSVTTPQPAAAEIDDQDELWDKISRGIPLNEDEINRLR